MEIVIHEFYKERYFFKDRNSKFLEYEPRKFTTAEKIIQAFNLYSIIRINTDYKDIIDFDCIIHIGDFALDYERNLEPILIFRSAYSNVYSVIARFLEIPFIGVADTNYIKQRYADEIIDNACEYEQPIIEIDQLEQKLRKFKITKDSKVLLLNCSIYGSISKQKRLVENIINILENYS